MSPIPVAIELRARTASFKWQVARCCYILFPGIGLGLSLRVKCPARVPIAGQHSSVAVARNVLHLEAVPLTERSTSLTNQHAIPVTVEPVTLLDGMLVGGQKVLSSRKRGHQ